MYLCKPFHANFQCHRTFIQYYSDSNTLYPHDVKTALTLGSRLTTVKNSIYQKLANPQRFHPTKYFIQQIIGSLLYYALAVDCTFLITLGGLASSQAQPTQETLTKLTWLLNYVTCNPDVKITYQASDMCLHVHSDASYLSAPKARNRTGAHFYLSDHPNKNLDIQLLNGPVHVVSNLINWYWPQLQKQKSALVF